MRSMKWAAAAFLAAVLVPAFLAAVLVPSAAQASPALRLGKDGTARVVDDRLLPPRARTALPAVPRGAAIARPSRRARAAELTPAYARATTARSMTRGACATG